MSWAAEQGEALAFLRSQPDASWDHIITDPPYTQAVSEGSRSVWDGKVSGRTVEFDGLPDGFIADLVPEMLRVAKRWVLSFCALEQLGEYRAAAGGGGSEKGCYVRGGIFRKPNAVPQLSGDRPAQAAEGLAIMHRKGRKRWNGGGAHGWWTATPTRERYGHPTPKPVSLMMELVEQFTDPGETILDPFCGSGTTGVACLRLGRVFHGVELAPHYVELARDRLKAEASGHRLKDARAGQLPMWGEP